MPTGWTRISNPHGQQEFVDLLGDPNELRRSVHKAVTDAGAGLDEIFYERRGGPAWVLTHVPGSGEHADAIFERLEEALGSLDKRLYTAEELDAGETAD